MTIRPLVIIPTFNEADNIESIVKETWKSVPDMHVLVVDDNSQDGTKAIVHELRVHNPKKFFLIERSGKLGLGTAYITGFKWALSHGYDAVIEMDADFSHNPKILKTFVTQIQHEPVIVGSRYVPGGTTENWNFYRKLISRFGSFYARTILGVDVRDLTGGFNAWQREVLDKINLDTIKSEGYSFQVELKYRAIQAGYSIKEIPITFSERRAGLSKMSLAIVIEAMFRVWVLKYSKRNHQISKKI